MLLEPNVDQIGQPAQCSGAYEVHYVCSNSARLPTIRTGRDPGQTSYPGKHHNAATRRLNQTCKSGASRLTHQVRSAAQPALLDSCC
jgi:hypothetical protein